MQRKDNNVYDTKSQFSYQNNLVCFSILFFYCKQICLVITRLALKCKTHHNLNICHLLVASYLLHILPGSIQKCVCTFILCACSNKGVTVGKSLSLAQQLSSSMKSLSSGIKVYWKQWRWSERKGCSGERKRSLCCFALCSYYTRKRYVVMYLRKHTHMQLTVLLEGYERKEMKREKEAEKEPQTERERQGENSR